MFYRLLAPFIKVVVRIFFRNVEIHGRERIPRDGPVLFAANHPNMAYDPVMVALVHHRRVHFLGKSGLFRFPPVAFLLRAVGAIPVYRRTDNPADASKNREAFAECYRVLEKGNAIGIFPEGTSLDVPRLLPLKTGAARIVFEAEENNDFKLGVKVIPVGLHFFERHIFRSDVLVQVGYPIDPAQWFDIYRTDSAAAVHALTDQVDESLRALTRNLKENQDGRLFEQLRRIYVEGFLGAEPDTALPATLKAGFDVDQGLIDAHAWFSTHQPERVQRVERDLERYNFLIEWLGVSDRMVGDRPRLAHLLRMGLLELPSLVVLGVPLVLYALVTSYLPYRLVGIVAIARTTDRVELATYKTALGMLFFSIWYGAICLVVAWRAGPVAALLAFPSFPVTGLLSLLVWERLDALWAAARALVLLRRDRTLAGRLEAARESIIDELRDLRREWLARPQEKGTELVSGN